MKNINKCPYCEGEMNLGVIHGDRYNLKWVPEEKDKGIVLQWLSKGLKLGNSIESYYCGECNKILIDVESNDN